MDVVCGVYELHVSNTAVIALCCAWLGMVLCWAGVHCASLEFALRNARRSS